MDYEQWNNLLVKHFFNEDHAGRQVKLYVTQAELDKIDPHGAQDFTQAIKTGPKTARGKGGPCSQAYTLWKNWDKKSPPPFIAYLVCFVLAWTLEHPSLGKLNYHGRLRRLLGEDDKEGPFPSFHLMDDLWLDLQDWANDHHEGTLGHFQARSIGHGIHVGFAENQATFSGAQRKQLHDLFAKHALSPFQEYAGSHLAKLITTHGKHILSDKQFAAASDPSRQEPHRSIINAVRSELKEWRVEYNAEKAKQYHPLLRLHIQERIGVAECFLHVQTTQDIPEDGNEIQGPQGERGYFEPQRPSISGPIRDEDTGQPLELEPDYLASGANWTTASGEALIIPPATVRYFALLPNGSPDELFERASLPSHGHCLIISDADCIAEVTAEVGDTTPVKQIAIRHGLPQNWRAFSVELSTLQDDDHGQASIILHGGIRTARGTTFFSFSPPTIEIQRPPEANVKVNDSAIEWPDPGYLLKKAPGRYVITVGTNEAVAARQTIHLTKAFPSPTEQPIKPPGLHTRSPGRSFTWHSGCRSPAPILLGESPGEYHRDATTRPLWTPRWMICPGRPNVATLLADRPGKPTEQTSPPPSPDSIKKWRAWSWGIRKRVRLTNRQMVIDDWNQLVERAYAAN